MSDLAQRARDIEPTIREAAFNILEAADISLFDARVAIQLVRDGLTDPVASVQESCKRMLVKWYQKKESIVDVR